eukprot:7152388-Pyramimonas_sp.AAC.2
MGVSPRADAPRLNRDPRFATHTYKHPADKRGGCILLCIRIDNDDDNRRVTNKSKSLLLLGGLVGVCT